MRRRPTPAQHTAARAPNNRTTPDGRASAQAEAAGVRAPEAPKAPRPFQSTEPDTDATTARRREAAACRALVLVILRTLPPAFLAPVLAALAMYLRALETLLMTVPDDVERAASPQARAMLHAATDGFEAAVRAVSADAWLPAYAMIAAWLCDTPKGVDATDASGFGLVHLAEALADVEAARELLSVEASGEVLCGVPPTAAPERAPLAPTPGRALRAILCDAAELASEEDDRNLSYSVCCAVAADGREGGRAFVRLPWIASALARMAAEVLRGESHEGTLRAAVMLRLSVECLDAYGASCGDARAVAAM